MSCKVVRKLSTNVPKWKRQENVKNVKIWYKVYTYICIYVYTKENLSYINKKVRYTIRSGKFIP